ncbi:MAG: DUF3866 family protein [Armatimonadota bacterium]|nr:MAG: DUF3866 family protein [Armatimonadota bacterium]
MSSPVGRSLLETEVGEVVEVEGERPGAQELRVRLEGGEERAINYPQLLGEVGAGERVLLNTTAVRAGLGTGGYHFVMKRAGAGEKRPEGAGRIVKLRYTPLQFRCLSVEEEGSPLREAIEGCEGLEGMPVIAAGLHSQIAPAAAAVKGLIAEARIAYIMTDTAALPLAFSQLAASLKEAGLIDATITVGQAFGGDYEAVNIFSGLLAARAVAGADVAIVAQGPGNVGTATEWGFGAIAQGSHVNAARVLDGTPVAIPRISFADERPRHRGVSRQFLVALGRVALVQALVSVPDMAPEKLEVVGRQLEDEGITAKHEVLVARGEVGVDTLAERGVEVKTMGRTVEEDPEFFLAAGAGGAIAAERLTWSENYESD